MSEDYEDEFIADVRVELGKLNANVRALVSVCLAVSLLFAAGAYWHADQRAQDRLRDFELRHAAAVADMETRVRWYERQVDRGNLIVVAVDRDIVETLTKKGDAHALPPPKR